MTKSCDLFTTDWPYVTLYDAIYKKGSKQRFPVESTPGQIALSQIGPKSKRPQNENKGNNKITEHRAIFQRERQNS